VAVAEGRVVGVVGRAATGDVVVDGAVQLAERVREPLRVGDGEMGARGGSRMQQRTVAAEDLVRRVRPIDTCERTSEPRAPFPSRSRMWAKSSVDTSTARRSARSPLANVSTSPTGLLRTGRTVARSARSSTIG